jgi:hypothetical protein
LSSEPKLKHGRRNAGPQDSLVWILNFFLCHPSFDLFLNSYSNICTRYPIRSDISPIKLIYQHK